jgi:maltose alpha-D-glucosyltransferase/alpha-amylase
VSAYFGLGDECHICFHFPLMPRIYMAIAQEDRHPITDIMRQTPDIPSNSQWAIFLRNHDELTLEMVTEKERDYLWSFYATDPRMRLNLGIRRRLAPLLGNDRPKIELLNSLLLSMPGTPVLSYGDEIGMGDNVFLGDRDGVRTPMQWSSDRNGGFSNCDPQRLYLPPIMDPIYGYTTVNVEAQSRSSSSLLNWMKRLIAVCRQHSAFGLGTLKFLYPGNRKVLAYLREHEGEALLCVANLSRAAQAVELDLSRFKGRVPVELLGRSPFPPIGDLPYLLTLPGYGFYWFVLPEFADAPRWHDVLPEPVPEFTTLVMRDGWNSLTSGREARELATSVLPNFIAKQRWFAAKDDRIARTDATVLGTLGKRQAGDYLLLMARLELEGRKESQHYFLPLDASWDEAAGTPNWPLTPFTLSRARRGSKVGAIYDAFTSDHFVLALIDAMRKGTELAGPDGTTRFTGTNALAATDLGTTPDIRRLGIEQSNSSVIIGDQAVLKIFRRLSEGEHPELEIARFLTEVAHFQNTPPLLGTAEQIARDGKRHALAIVSGFVRNQGDGWVFTTEYLDRIFDEVRLVERADAVPPEVRHATYLGQVAMLGRRTAELHAALGSATEDPSFKPEPIRAADINAWVTGAKKLAQAAFALLAKAQASAPEHLRGPIDTLFARKDECFAAIEQLGKGPVAAAKTRIHGDYHLGQVLVAKNDFYIIDFEGEPARTMQERRLKSSPFKDIAGMLRSFEYAEWAALFAIAEHEADSVAKLLPFAEAWRKCAQAKFLDSYLAAIGDCPSCPKDRATLNRLLGLFTLEKALYEICYEATNRPTWLRIPIAGLQSALDGLTERKGAGDAGT